MNPENLESNSLVQLEDNWTNPTFEEKIPFVSRIIIKYSGGLINNTTQVLYLFIGITIFCILLSLFLVTNDSERRLPTNNKGIVYENI